MKKFELRNEIVELKNLLNDYDNMNATDFNNSVDELNKANKDELETILKLLYIRIKN